MFWKITYKNRTIIIWYVKLVPLGFRSNINLKKKIKLRGRDVIEDDIWIIAYLFYLFRQRVDGRTVKNHLHFLHPLMLHRHISPCLLVTNKTPAELAVVCWGFLVLKTSTDTSFQWFLSCYHCWIFLCIIFLLHSVTLSVVRHCVLPSFTQENSQYSFQDKIKRYF